MFFVHTPVSEYVEPWAVPLEKRIKQLFSEDRRIAYFYEKPDSSTFRYRVYNMIQTIHEINGMSATYFCLEDLDYLNSTLDCIDVLIFCRTRYTAALNHLISRAKNKGVKILFDVDDLVFNSEKTDLILDTLDQNMEQTGAWDHWYAYIGRIGALLKQCDGCITTNSFLADQISRFHNTETIVIPNFLNQEQVTISDAIYSEKLSSNFKRTKHINIGYFSGTPTHNKDFAITAEFLAKLLKQDERVKLMIVGYLDLPDVLRTFLDRIEIFPLCDFINLQKVISLAEINIIPLQNNIFTNCKSELKFFEASVVGTISIASPTFTYKAAIDHGKNGYLSEDYEWGETLDKAIKSLDNGTYQKIAEAARYDSLNRYAWYNQKHLFGKI
tara:strand:- start:24 stop:1178 length:1155 start_codon:yes stop_codon:yes gene_type:complete